MASPKSAWAGGMRQRDKHLSAEPPLFPDVILDRRVATSERMLIPQPFKNVLGGVALFAVPAEIFLQPLVDEARETVELGPLDPRRSLITGRGRKHHHLLHACTRNPEMAGGHPFAHTAPTREADLQI